MNAQFLFRTRSVRRSDNAQTRAGSHLTGSFHRHVGRRDRGAVLNSATASGTAEDLRDQGAVLAEIGAREPNNLRNHTFRRCLRTWMMLGPVCDRDRRESCHSRDGQRLFSPVGLSVRQTRGERRRRLGKRSRRDPARASTLDGLASESPRSRIGRIPESEHPTRFDIGHPGGSAVAASMRRTGLIGAGCTLKDLGDRLALSDSG
jgi:hypothetical protein